MRALRYNSFFSSVRMLAPIALALSCGTAARVAQAQEPTIEISTDQRVSVSGRGPSRKTVIEDVCFRAGVDLLFYDAADRAFGGSYSSLPLASFLERVLAEESYIIESVSVPGTNIPRVTTLRVLGDPAVASQRRSHGGGVRQSGFRVPSMLVDTAFGGSGAAPDDQAAALATLAQRISGDPEQLRGFLATEASQIAQAIRRFENVEQPLRELQRRYPDPRIQAKIDDILGELAKAPARVSE